MRLGLLTCFWKRWKLSRLTIDYWSMLDVPGVEIVPAAAWSNDPQGTKHDWKRVLDRNGWLNCESPNRPLGRKHNTALGLLREANVDAVMVVGSDDFASPEWVEYGCRKITEGRDMVSLRSFYLYSVDQQRLVYAVDTPIGAGRFLSRAVLDSVGWNLWDFGLNTGLDGSATTNIQRNHGGEWTNYTYIDQIKTRGFFLVDVKAECLPDACNIWEFDRIAVANGRCFEDDPLLMDRYLGGWADKIRGLKACDVKHK